MVVEKNGRTIHTVAEWRELAPPKRGDQWKKNRSAMEAANAWLSTPNGGLPAEVADILESHEQFGTVFEWRAEPEVRLPFDDFPGEPRNTDLLVVMFDKHGPYLMCVEAKADEPFGESVADAAANAIERGVSNRASRGVERISQLVETLFGVAQEQKPPLRNLRYQLLTATAGSLAEAVRRQVDRVVLLVHEFVTCETTDKRHEENARDLNLFVRRLSGGDITGIQVGQLYGPFLIPGRPLLDSIPSLYIGKVVRNLR